MRFSEKIKKIAKSYFEELDKEDFSHGFSHVERVTKLALRIGEKEQADLEVLETAGLLHDIGRKAEDQGEIEDHAEESAKLAGGILKGIGFPKDKINNVCASIRTHRYNPEKPAASLEAKILQDADRLDALGAVDIARVIGSKLQSEKYGGPIYIDKAYRGEEDVDTSAIHYLIYKSRNPKRKPESFNTKTGKKLAKDRYDYMLKFIDRFIKEWRGEI